MKQKEKYCKRGCACRWCICETTALHKLHSFTYGFSNSTGYTVFTPPSYSFTSPQVKCVCVVLKAFPAKATTTLVCNSIQGTIWPRSLRESKQGQDNSRSHNAIAVKSMGQFVREPNELEKHGGPWFWLSM